MKKLFLSLFTITIAWTFNTNSATLHCYCKGAGGQYTTSWEYVGGPYKQVCESICSTSGGSDKATVD